MAYGYGCYGSRTYKNEELKDAILYALGWMYDNLYGEGIVTKKNQWRDTSLFNWWDWQIGSPSSLIDTLMIMEGDMEKSDIQKYLAPVDILVRQPWDSGSNVIDMAMVIMGSGLLRGDGARVLFARKYIEDVMKFTESGNGFHHDGSYVFHNVQAMNNA